MSGNVENAPLNLGAENSRFCHTFKGKKGDRHSSRLIRIEIPQTNSNEGGSQ